jgi:hypothetical protein
MKNLLRVLFFLVVVITTPALATTEVNPADGILLKPLAAHVYKTRDPGNESTESWTFWLLVETTTQRDLKVQSARIQLRSGEQAIRSTHYDTDGVKALTIAPPFAPRLLDGSAPSTPIHWPLAIRIRSTEAQAAKVDEMRIELILAEGGKSLQAAVVVPVETYVQKTALIYPFKGHGIITNAGVTNGGHRNRSGQFALDGVGLGPGYNVSSADGGNRSVDYAGWGRTVFAPAAGVIVQVRSDRPDQPNPEVSDPKFYAPEFPQGGDPGNHVVIDHGNGEFSLLAHFQADSVRVKAGDHVKQGQPLGKIGSSGDTVTPHLHYQLQSGPDIVWSDGLPCRFDNIEPTILVRGAYFDAK